MSTHQQFDRERELAARMRELADGTVVPDARAMEERLVRAFAERSELDHAARRLQLLTPRRTPAGRRAWLKVAAAVAIIIASAILSSRVSRVSRGPEPQADADALTGFVMLPEAAALPAFESGRIVRVAVPLASLPAFGLEVIPDAAATQVEADLLVGQDGLPRAIRLASTISPYTPYRSR